MPTARRLTASTLDVYDIVALNAFEEVPDYYVPWLNKREKQAESAAA